MKIYSSFGFNDFIIALGANGDVIKDYFYNFESKNNDFFTTLRTEFERELSLFVTFVTFQTFQKAFHQKL